MRLDDFEIDEEKTKMRGETHFLKPKGGFLMPGGQTHLWRRTSRKTGAVTWGFANKQERVNRTKEKEKHALRPINVRERNDPPPTPTVLTLESLRSLFQEEA